MHDTFCLKLLQLTHCRSPMHMASEVARRLQKEWEICSISLNVPTIIVCCSYWAIRLRVALSPWQKIREKPHQYDIVMSKQKNQPTSLFVAWLYIVMSRDSHITLLTNLSQFREPSHRSHPHTKVPY